jgi:putative SOS response-associated peptidase YedK
MCGRYTLTVEANELAERFGCPTVVPLTRPRYNIAPSQILPVIVATEGQNQILPMKWGLIPFWAKDAKIGYKMINARVETLAEKPAFKYALKQRRCIVPANGYYEWQATQTGKRPMFITVPDSKLFGFAGLWEQWISPDRTPILSYTIITSNPSNSVANIHDRMPLILNREQEEYWLQGLTVNDNKQLKTFLSQIRPIQDLVSYQVSTRVNSPKNDDHQCIEPI